MATAVIMPKQGQSVETCIITKWFRKQGDHVNAGDIILSYETDKASFDLESPVSGVLLVEFFGEGDEVPVLATVAVIGKTGESVAPFISGKVAGNDQPLPVNPPESGNESFPSAGLTVPENSGNRVRISPRAKRLAENKKVNYGSIRGSGPNGRIVSRDIENIISTAEANKINVNETTIEYSEQPLGNIRKIIAKAMHASLQESAQLTHHMSADVRSLLEARKNIKNKRTAGNDVQDITLNDMVCFCVIRALKKFPGVNSHFLTDRIRTFNKIHLGIAVDTPRGLMVPVVKNTGDMDLTILSKELKSVSESCRKGNINPELLLSSAATFTVSNLGNYGVEMFTPVINLPQIAILGVCTIINRPADIGNNTFGFVPFIGLSLTYDHRAIDGGPATLFLKEIKDQIEKFTFNIG